MRVVLITTIIFLFSFAVAKNDKDAKAVAIKFLNAYKAKDYITAKKYATESAKGVIDMMESTETVDKVKPPKVTIKIVSVKEDGSKCEVRYEGSDNPEEERVINLLKVDGKWLVELTKDDDID